MYGNPVPEVVERQINFIKKKVKTKKVNFLKSDPNMHYQNLATPLDAAHFLGILTMSYMKSGKFFSLY
jgi:hypothetical protein